MTTDLMEAAKAAASAWVSAERGLNCGEVTIDQWREAQTAFHNALSAHQAEVERLRKDLKEAVRMRDFLNAAVHNHVESERRKEDELAALRARVADVLRPFAAEADTTGTVPDDWQTSQHIRERHLRAAAALLREMDGK